MESIVFIKEDLGITKYDYHNYNICPIKSPGSSGFKYSFRNYKPSDSGIISIVVDGHYSHNVWPVKDTLQTNIFIRARDMCYSLISYRQESRIVFNSDGIPREVLKLMERFKEFIRNTPDPSNKHMYGDNGGYAITEGIYHYRAWPNKD